MGVDPGESGALFLLSGDGALLDWLDMPMVGRTNTKMKFVDGLATTRWISERNPDLIVCEMVGSRPEQGVSTTMQFGVNYGGIVTACLAIPVPFQLVTPTVWKRAFGLLGLPKKASGAKAFELAGPETKAVFFGPRGGVKDGRADGYLIARYGLHLVHRTRKYTRR